MTLPARGLLVLAANPCPCGNFSVNPQLDRCDCAEAVRRAYRAKVSGPITDRIDITRHVRPARGSERDRFRPPESSAEVRRRVVEPEAQRVVDQETYRGRLGTRGAVRVLRLAWTVADLASARSGEEVRPGVAEVDTALRLRVGHPLVLPERAERPDDLAERAG